MTLLNLVNGVCAHRFPSPPSSLPSLPRNGQGKQIPYASTV